MILVRSLRLEPGESEDKLRKKAARELRIHENEISELTITKKSLDARKKNDIHWLYSAAVKTRDEEKILARSKSKNVCRYEHFEYTIPRIEAKSARL